MDTNQSYEIIRDIIASLKTRGEDVKLLPPVPDDGASLEQSGIDLIAFSEFAEELSNRFNGKDFHLEPYFVREEFYYLTIGKLTKLITAAFEKKVTDSLIVYVDDEEENIFIFKRKFGKKLNLKAFIDSTEALEFIRMNDNVSLVITDESMPKLGGNELCDAVHKTKPLMKFILITGNPNGDGDLMYKSLRHNRFYEFINKPLDMENKAVDYLALIQGLVNFNW